MSANGRLLPLELAAVQGSITLAPRTAAAYKALNAAAVKAGKKIAIPIDGGYRDLERQTYMYQNRARYPGKTIAYPGTSPHGTGRCFDIVGDLAYVIAHAAEYGLSRPVVGDLNHFQHDGVTVPASTNTEVITPDPIEEDTDMKLVFSTLGFWSLYTANGFYVIGEQANADKIHRALNGAGNAADINYLNSILYGPRWQWNAATGGWQPTLPSVLPQPAVAGPGAITQANIDAIAKQVEANLADDFAKLGANIDDQPTHFKIDPA